MHFHTFDVSLIDDTHGDIPVVTVRAASPEHALQCGIILMSGAHGVYSVWDAEDNQYMPVLESTIGAEGVL